MNLDSPSKRPDAAVDEILAELRAKSGQPAKPADSELDRILAELKSGTVAQKPRAVAPPAPKAAPRAEETRPQQPAPRPEPKAPPAQRAEPPTTEAAPPPPAAAKPPRAGAEGTARPAPKAQAPGAHTLLERATISETRRLPVLGDPASLDPIGPRAGKAAALEKVEQDKYVGDEELTSWFGADNELHTSRRDTRRAEKQRKKQQKLEGRGRRAEEQPELPAYEDDLPAENLAVAQPEDGGQALREALQEIEKPAGLPPRPGRSQPEPLLPGEGLSLFEFAQTAGQQAAPEEEDEWVDDEDDNYVPGERTLAFRAIRGALEEKLSEPAPKAEKTQMFKAQAAAQAELGKTQAFVAGSEKAAAPELGATKAFAGQAHKAEKKDTKQFDIAAEDERRVPTAAYTQEFEKEQLAAETAAAAAAATAATTGPKGMGQGQKNLYVDEMVDDKFRAFFGETVIVDQNAADYEQRSRRNKKTRRSRTALLTGEFAKLTEAAEEENQEDFDDYSNPQDAEQVEADLVALRKTLSTRSILSGVAALLLFWLAFGYTGVLPLPEFLAVGASPLMFAMVYLALVVGVIVLNFTTVASGLIGLFGEPTVDTTGAIASVAALLQGVVLLVQLLTDNAADVTLFGTLAALILCFNSLGKKVRSTAILENFRQASGGLEHSAAYVVDGGQEVAYHITKGLEEENPSILISRPTALVKGFLRQSFSMRWSDRMGKILGWVLLGTCLVAEVIAYFATKDIMQAVTCMAAVACIGAPLSATLLSGVPSRLLQQGSGKLGAVVPGWSAIEDLGNVNVVMAGARDIFPAKSLCLKGIKTFEQERIDLAILYAASILVEGCDTLRDIFMGVIQGKQDMLFKVENLMSETGRGFMGFVDNNRVLVGTREMMQMHDIDPPPLEVEMKVTADGSLPLYLAVSGKLFAMFLVGYSPEEGVQGTLDGLVRSGLSVLVTSEDPNVSSELIERVYQLPKGVVKVLGRREMEMLEPLRSYLPESEGVMTHIGTFTSFIGGMRAAAGCAASERMSAIVQAAGVGLACLLCLLLAISGGLSILSLSIVLLYQLGWAALVSILPFARRY